MKSKIITLLIFLICIAAALCSCDGREIIRTYVDDNNCIIGVYSDGSEEVLGEVEPAITVVGTKVNEECHVIVEYSDGTTKDLGYVGVIDEALNVEVEKTTINDQFHVIVEFTNGTTKDLGYVGVIDPSKNIEVEQTTVNDQFHLIVTFTDGTSKDMGYVGVLDESLNVVVSEIKVDENMHLIVTYSNGTTDDLGYVGVRVEVEVEPPLYTVTFVDYYGNVLSVQEVYRGKAAKAPAAPEVADKVFSGWNVDFTNVQEDLRVTPVYDNAAEYTVTFKDADGTILKTQTVISGHAATAPNVSDTEDKIFTGWDNSFENVKSDLVLTAQYRPRETYTVTFKDYSGLVLGTTTVKEGGTATAPVTPSRDGYSFTGWSSSLSNITSNKTVTAQYRLNSGENVLDVSYKINSNNTITVTFAVTGTVKFCGLEGYVDVPAGLKFESLTQGDGATANFADGKIYFMFASNNGQNVTKTTTLMTVTFSYTGDFSSAILNTVVSDIYDQNYVNMTCTVIGGEIKVK